MGYGEKMPALLPQSRLIFLDFTFPRAIMNDLAMQHRELLILDHHETAEKDLAGLDEEHQNVLMVIDQARSGAMIAWDYFHAPESAPSIFHYVQDYDLWQFKLPYSKEVNESVYSYTQNFKQWDILCKRGLMTLCTEGEALLRYQQKHVATICATPRGVYINKQLVPVVNAPYFLRNDCCHLLLETYPDAPFAASYSDSGNGDRVWSLRSDDARTDVRLVAEELGGGGHRNAAGFRSRATDNSPAFSNFEYTPGRHEV